MTERLLSRNDVFLCRASGEGSHDFRICPDAHAVASFYKELFGEDHGGGIESFWSGWNDPDDWSNEGTALELALYCATFQVWKVDPKQLSLASESRLIECLCPKCGVKHGGLSEAQ